jgi:hypothetical protein
MTEVAWPDCNDLESMPKYPRGEVSECKLHLFACACGRVVKPTFDTTHFREIMEMLHCMAHGRHTFLQRSP